MKQRSIMLAALLFLVTNLPAAEPVADEGIDVALLSKAWTHSREEDANAKGNVYRLSDSMQFPRSRFRMKYEFNADGTGKMMYLHPADRHRMVAMQWKADTENPRLLHITAKTDGKKLIKTLEVLELTDKLLRVK